MNEIHLYILSLDGRERHRIYIDSEDEHAPGMRAYIEELRRRYPEWQLDKRVYQWVGTTTVPEGGAL